MSKEQQKNTIKIKPMSAGEMTLAIDRLTRFKFPEEKYNRVFREIISKHLICPKISFKEYSKLPAKEITNFIELIFAHSLNTETIEDSLGKFVYELETNLYKIDANTENLIKTKIPYEKIISLNMSNELCQNLKLLQKIYTESGDSFDIRKKYKTKFPLEKIVLAEGITEEILLPKFAQIMDYDFNENGIGVIAAGGKNQVAKEYLKLRERLKIPIIILLDADAKKIAETISIKLREEDKLILIEKGEFEDILPLKLLKKAINYSYKNIFSISVNDFSNKKGRVKDLEEIYRINGLGEFKKAEFANNINSLLKPSDKNFISDEIKAIIDEIKS